MAAMGCPILRERFTAHDFQPLSYYEDVYKRTLVNVTSVLVAVRHTVSDKKSSPVGTYHDHRVRITASHSTLCGYAVKCEQTFEMRWPDGGIVGPQALLLRRWRDLEEMIAALVAIDSAQRIRGERP